MCVGVGVEDATNLAEAVVGEEEEETVLDDGAADGAAELLLLVDGLGEEEGVSVVMERLELVVGIEGVEVRDSGGSRRASPWKWLVPDLVMALT